MKLNPETLKAFRHGISISDEQLKELHTFYGELVESLNSLGDEYYLAWRSAFLDHHAICSMMDARMWDYGTKIMHDLHS